MEQAHVLSGAADVGLYGAECLAVVLPVTGQFLEDQSVLLRFPLQGIDPHGAAKDPNRSVRNQQTLLPNLTVKALSSSKDGGSCFQRCSWDSPERHCCADVLRRSFDAVLVLHQVLHFLHRFLHHYVPAAHPVQVPLQRLIQEPDGHHLVLHVPGHLLAGAL